MEYLLSEITKYRVGQNVQALEGWVKEAAFILQAMWKAQKGVSMGETGLVHFMENVDDAGKIVLREKKSYKTGQV